MSNSSKLETGQPRRTVVVTGATSGRCRTTDLGAPISSDH